MSTGTEYPNEASTAMAASLEGDRMRVLLVADRVPLAAAIQSVLEKSPRGDFELVVERDLACAARRIQAERVDLLLLDLALADVRRSVLVDRASELATRLPVVALSGTEAFAPNPSDSSRALQDQLEEADLAAVLQRTLRRARRLGSVALAPVFCRLESFGA